MIVKSIKVRNFRSLRDATLNCDPLTALIGPNGGGKSSVLRALELFYAASPRLDAEDFYDRDTEEDVEVEVTFTNLSADAKTRFASYLQGDELAVVRVFSLRDGRLSWRFYGSRLQNPDFASVRTADNATAARKAYDPLRTDPKYSGLPAWSSQSSTLTALGEWEEANPSSCVRQRDEGQFFGFSEVGKGYLGRFTRLISIPAVRDASEEAAEGRGRPISEIMDLVVRNRLASQDSIEGLRTETRARYGEILSEAAKQTDELGKQLSTRLGVFVPGAAVRLALDSAGAVDIQLPKAEVKLVEDDYETEVSHTGHGLQRAFIMAMLHEVAVAQATSGREATATAPNGAEAELEPSPGSTVILAIEEPELYQHPSRQRHLANILSQLSTGGLAGATDRIQVIYATHSPLFVGIDRFANLRMLRKIPGESGRPRVTKVTQVSGDAVAEAIWEACDKKDRNGHPVDKFTWYTLEPRLQAIMTPWMAEGFFADVAVLVEGADDRAAVLGATLARGKDLESSGYAIIPCGGKASMDRPAVIFKKFGIRTFLVWDSDRENKDARSLNHRLLRISGATVEDYPAGVGESYGCFENKLEDTVKNEIGEDVLAGLLDACKEEFELSQRDDAIKNPFIFGEVIRRAAEQGKRSDTLESIVDALLSLKED